MTLFIACILLYQFEWPWYWYPVAMIIWVLHELHVFTKFNRFRKHPMRREGEVRLHEASAPNGDQPS